MWLVNFVHQYLFLSKFAFWHKLPIDIGVIGIHDQSYLYHFLDNNLVRKNNNNEIDDKKHPVSYLKFPLFKRPKHQLLKASQDGGYDGILKLTWSCWFPKNGTPCGKCPMCRERIIGHPDNSK